MKTTKEQLNNYLKTVHTVARSYSMKCSTPFDDLVQIGSIGMLKAINIFNSKINDNFIEFSKRYIVGEIKHYLRDSQYMVKIPREIQELSYKVSKLVKLGMSYDDIAEHLNISIEKVNHIMNTFSQNKSFISLDCSSKEEGTCMLDNLQSKECCNDTSILVNNALNQLDTKYKDVVTLTYLENMKQVDVSKKLGITPMQVSRLLNTGLKQLRELIEA